MEAPAQLRQKVKISTLSPSLARSGLFLSKRAISGAFTRPPDPSADPLPTLLKTPHPSTHPAANHPQKKRRALRPPGGHARLKLGRVLDELCAHRRTRMHNSGAAVHARQSSADESVRGQQQMIGLSGTSRLTKVKHGTSFCVTATADRA